MTTTQLPISDTERYDYVVVGGGTAGCVIGARLAEYLPHKRILLIEAGPSDYNDDRVLDLRKWLDLLGGELDYDYGTTEQPEGKRLSLLVRYKCLVSLTQYQETRTSATRVPRFWEAAPLTTP
jgi:choline dehydrogenase-like flavoprotein